MSSTGQRQHQNNQPRQSGLFYDCTIMEANTLPNVHRISAACEKLQISRATLYRMAKAGTIELVRVSKGASRVTDASLRKLLTPDPR